MDLTDPTSSPCASKPISVSDVPLTPGGIPDAPTRYDSFVDRQLDEEERRR